MDDDQLPDDGLAGEIWLAGRAWNEQWVRRTASPPEALYHYTDAAGLLGILEGGELWASNAAFLNDATELVHIQGVLEQVAFSLEREYENDLVREFLGLVTEQFERLYIKGMEVFVACFCENPDLLSQWRGYPPSGGGYAIGFESAAIRQRGWLQQITYHEEAQLRAIRSLLTPHCDLLPQAASETQDYRHKCLVLAVQMATSSLAECAFAFKHAAFTEEAEWRLVRVMMREREPPVGGTPLFRIRRNGLLPYTSFDLSSARGRGPISQIIVGPSPHPDLAMAAARRLLESAGYETAAEMVVRSAIPLRV